MNFCNESEDTFWKNIVTDLIGDPIPTTRVHPGKIQQVIGHRIHAFSIYRNQASNIDSRRMILKQVLMT